MIEQRAGDIFESGAQALVNPVNCVGVMGAGLALQFAERFPEIVPQYLEACGQKKLTPGTLDVFDRGSSENPRWIVNLPTKRHWKNPSLLPDVVSGLTALRAWAQAQGVGSVALAPPGAGLGGLPQADVDVEVQRALGDAPFEVMYYSGEKREKFVRLGVVNVSAFRQLSEKERGFVVYCGRSEWPPSKLGIPREWDLRNQAKVADAAGRHEAIELFAQGFVRELRAKEPQTVAAVTRLFKRAQRDGELLLGCHCKPAPCHCDIIVRYMADRLKSVGYAVQVRTNPEELLLDPAPHVNRAEEIIDGYCVQRRLQQQPAVEQKPVPVQRRESVGFSR